jgi:leader peptidase (prepilin peptidase)/N-methyltransferase
MPVLVALSLIVVLDLRTRVIPDVLTLSGLAYTLGMAAVLRSPPLGQAALGALVCGGVVLVVAVVSNGKIGGGDIKLMALVGAALGWKLGLLVLGLAQILGAVVVMAVMLVRRRRPSSGFPIGFVIALLGAVILVGAP